MKTGTDKTDEPVKRGAGRPASRRDDGGEGAHLHLRCRPRDKGAFVLAARGAGVSLSEWLIHVATVAVPPEVWQAIEKSERDS